MPAKSTGRHVKMVLVGDMSVGKTSLATVFVHKAFTGNYVSTIGGHFMAKTLEDPHVTLQIWDTAGMERFRSMLPHFMRDAMCAVIVYDVCDRDSFESVRDYWIDYVEQNATENLVMVLVGNKVDKVDSRAVKTVEGENLADEHSMLFMETSAKTGDNVDILFTQAARLVNKTIPEKPTNGFQIGAAQPSKSRCCLSRSHN